MGGSSCGLVALRSGWHLQDQAERQPEGREVSHTHPGKTWQEVGRGNPEPVHEAAELQESN